ncbi:hypothetical protein JCM8202_003713 [Rhodotorula sphaerocarpa]
MPRKKVTPTQPELMHEEDGGLEAFELPKSVVARIAREALPSDIKLQKEVPLALVKGSTVFINYLAALSHDVATERNNKTIAATHVLDAVKQLGWEDGGELHRQLKKDLAAFRAANEAKKKGLPPPAAPAPAPKRPQADPASKATSDDVAMPPPPRGSPRQGAPETGDDRTTADEAGEQPPDAAAADEEDDITGIEEYVDEAGDDQEMEDAGSEGVEDDDGGPPADPELDEDDEPYQEGQE